jgi:hypothetical protein
MNLKQQAEASFRRSYRRQVAGMGGWKKIRAMQDAEKKRAAKKPAKDAAKQGKEITTV